MRIIAGSRKGHTIYAPKGLDTRPTSDRAREAAFNLIGPVDEARVLDLYAGSGALGLEALSRGAAAAVFVDSAREACRAIERNLDKLRLTGAVGVPRSRPGGREGDGPDPAHAAAVGRGGGLPGVCPAPCGGCARRPPVRAGARRPALPPVLGCRARAVAVRSCGAGRGRDRRS